jgi:hypothetical protein
MASGLPKEGVPVGSRIVLITSSGEEVKGIVFAFCDGLLLLVADGSHRGVKTVRLVAAGHVAEVLSTQLPDAGVDLALPMVRAACC